MGLDTETWEVGLGEVGAGNITGTSREREGRERAVEMAIGDAL